MSRFNVEELLLDIDIQLANPQTSEDNPVSTYSDLRWVLSDVSVSSLTRKESYVSLPHANDVIDFSEYGGTAHYEPREVTYTFWHTFNSKEDMIQGTYFFERLWYRLSVNSAFDKVYDPTIYSLVRDGVRCAMYWARPRCIGFERKYYPLSNLAEATVKLKVYPLPQADPWP